jgi:hypothetical protein
MKRLVRYKVKPERAAENEAYIERVFEQLKRQQPPGLRYASFKLEDGVSFVHIVEMTDGRHPLSELTAFQEFVAGVRERCDVPPVTEDLNEIGSYRFFES